MKKGTKVRLEGEVFRNVDKLGCFDVKIYGSQSKRTIRVGRDYVSVKNFFGWRKLK